jgi:hypothetical protein
LIKAAYVNGNGYRMQRLKKIVLAAALKRCRDLILVVARRGS